MTLFGDVLISIGGCNPLKETCESNLMAYKVMTNDEEDQLLMTETHAMCSDTNGKIKFYAPLGFPYCSCDANH